MPSQSLIGNIADSSNLDGKGFFVGSNFLGTVPIADTTKESGKLFSGFNDGAVYCNRSGYDSWGFGGDNHGSFTVEITIDVQEPTLPFKRGDILLCRSPRSPIPGDEFTLAGIYVGSGKVVEAVAFETEDFYGNLKKESSRPRSKFGWANRM